MTAEEMTDQCLIRAHIQREHPGFEDWTTADFREQFPGLILPDGTFSYRVLDFLLHIPDEMVLILIQL